jgi:hypothetical protein
MLSNEIEKEIKSIKKMMGTVLAHKTRDLGYLIRSIKLEKIMKP